MRLAAHPLINGPTERIGETRLRFGIGLEPKQSPPLNFLVGHERYPGVVRPVRRASQANHIGHSPKGSHSRVAPSLFGLVAEMVHLVENHERLAVSADLMMHRRIFHQSLIRD